MRPSAISRRMWPRFVSDQPRTSFRGVQRCMYRSSSIRFTMPSIHPKHSASSSASSYVTLALPVCRL